ncbi:hypothetical protein FO519_009230 [Halicephalobus sp. NKZ332]|nr:hypothetical protein FO519_009230 [Halicephalobus sp. NKZ332]
MENFAKKQPTPLNPIRGENNRNPRRGTDSGLGSSLVSTPTKSVSSFPSPGHFSTTTSLGLDKTTQQSTGKQSYANALNSGIPKKSQHSVTLGQLEDVCRKLEQQGNGQKVGSKVKTNKDLLQTPKRFNPNELDGNKLKSLQRQISFEIPMSDKIPYRVVVSFNFITKGLLHIMINSERIEYWDWILPYYDSSSSLRSVAGYVEKVKVGKKNVKKINVDDLSKDQFIKTYNIQIDGYNAIKKITADNNNYLGKGINSKNNPQLYWETQDMNGNHLFMVMGLSKESYLFPAGSDEQNTSNCYRELITIFFISQEEYMRRKRKGWIKKQ